VEVKKRGRRVEEKKYINRKKKRGGSRVTSGRVSVLQSNNTQQYQLQASNTTLVSLSL
jgi:hypothetical protein